jgi:magnesium chelatase family protein
MDGGPDGRCSCSPSTIARYRTRISGPLLDRFDLVIPVPPVEPAALVDAPAGESSAAVRARVVAARERQRRRFGSTGPNCNARMGVAELNRFASLGAEQKRLLFRACDRLGLSARGFDRVRRVARTLADLEDCDTLGACHVAEALQSRHSATLWRD